MIDVKAISDPLKQVLEPHLERLNAAGELLSSMEVPRHLISGTFDGLANAIVLCHGLSVHSGWWTGKDGTPIDPMDKNVFGCKLALVHSEISEALEGGRKNHNDLHLTERKALEVELADALIRIFDLAGAMHLDLAGATIEKLAYNQQRADHKPENRFADGGKAF